MSPQSLQEVAQEIRVDEALVEEIVDAFNRGNVDEIVEYFHEDGIFQTARGPAPTGIRVEGKEAIRKFLKERSAQTPDWKWISIRNWCADDKAVAEWKVVGTDASGETLRMARLRYSLFRRRQNDDEGYLLERPQRLTWTVS